MSLNTLLGRRYTSFFRVSREKVQEYVSVLQERNPYYRDPGFTRQSSYGSLIAPPAFAVVYLYRTVTQLFADPIFKPHVPHVLHGEQKVEFDKVVKVGDTIDTEMKVSNVTTKVCDQDAPQDVIELRFVSWNQDREVVNRAMTSLILKRELLVG